MIAVQKVNSPNFFYKICRATQTMIYLLNQISTKSHDTTGLMIWLITGKENKKKTVLLLINFTLRKNRKRKSKHT
jgi:hypothetical protein